MDFNSQSFQVIELMADLNDLPFVVITEDLKISFCSETAKSKFSFDSSAITGKAIDEVFDGIKLRLEVFANVFKKKQPKKVPNVVIQSKSPYVSDLTLIPYENCQIIFIKQYNFDYDSQSTQIIKKKSMLGHLIANICNNFNNIIGAISGNSYILRETSENIPNKETKIEILTYLELIDKSVSRATELVAQLSSFSTKVNVVFKEIDLNDIIRNLYIDYLSKLGPEIVVDAEVLSNKANARIDPSLIQDSIKDICENAVHAMTIMRGEDKVSQGGTLSITLDHIETDREYRAQHPKAVKSSYWIITISDTGVGIKKENLKKISTPFFTEGKSVLNPDGLGLSVAYNTVQENGGFIEIESEVNLGTKVKIFLPEYIGQEKINIGSPSPEKKPSPKIVPGVKNIKTSDSKQSMVLIADDDLIMRRVAEVVLERAGYKVLVATDGEEALNIYKEKHSSITGVFLDISMPKMSGIEAFYEIKKINPDIKALLLSGHEADSEEVQTAMANGIKGFIKKPYTMLDLNKKVKELLGN